MPKSIGASVFGARLAKELLLKVERCNRESVEKSGDLDLEKVADLLDAALQEPRSRRGIMLALAEYLATAVDYKVIELASWHPLEYFDRNQKSPTPVKRF